jgi:hypothetical protein
MLGVKASVFDATERKYGSMLLLSLFILALVSSQLWRLNIIDGSSARSTSK